MPQCAGRPAHLELFREGPLIAGREQPGVVTALSAATLHVVQGLPTAACASHVVLVVSDNLESGARRGRFGASWHA
jgi:hypothetical protein